MGYASFPGAFVIDKRNSGSPELAALFAAAVTLAASAETNSPAALRTAPKLNRCRSARLLASRNPAHFNG